jgi:hypothetical protein
VFAFAPTLALFSVSEAELFSELFLKDLDLLWRVDLSIYIPEQAGLDGKLATNF